MQTPVATMTKTVSRAALARVERTRTAQGRSGVEAAVACFGFIVTTKDVLLFAIRILEIEEAA